MLEKIMNLPEGIEGVRAAGVVSREDYKQVFEPVFERAQREGHRVRLLYQFGPEFERFSAQAAWEDARLGLRSTRLLAACAIVSDLDWIRQASRLVGFFIPCPVKVFSNDEGAEAIEWLKDQSQRPATSHRMLPELGVVAVEVDEALAARDFEALAATADAWIESHGKLNGLVVQARNFPGWENLRGLTQHLRFVRDHHEKIGRVALATDSKLAGVAPALARHFVDAEIKRFDYDDVDSATQWAGRAGDGVGAARS
jgi:hypothetical protein